MKNTPFKTRSGWKRKPKAPKAYPPSKKPDSGQIQPKKRRKKTERKKLEDELWELCKKITRLRYQSEDGFWRCYTSGQIILEPKNVHTGHGKPKGALPLKYQYDLRNLRPQCYHANINLGGMQDIFIARLEREKEGLQFLKEACVKIDGEWKIKREEPMGSLQAEEFLRATVNKYQKIWERLNRER